MRGVTSCDIAAYLPLTRKLAHQFDGQFGAEFDDLEQEGRIKVWNLLRFGFPVSSKAVADSMRDHVRYCKRQGLAYGEDSYVAL